MSSFKIEIFEGSLDSAIRLLLFEADPNMASCEAAYRRGTLYCAYLDGVLIGVAILMFEAAYVELSHLAIVLEHRGVGHGRIFIIRLMALARADGHSEMHLSTGNSSLLQLGLYQRCGFRIYDIVSDYFASYPAPIFENGIQCLDLIKLRASLCDIRRG